MSFPTPNPDESLACCEIVNPAAAPADQMNAPFIGNFHKTLPHNEHGEVNPAAYREFERTCIQIEAGAPLNFEVGRLRLTRLSEAQCFHSLNHELGSSAGWIL